MIGYPFTLANRSDLIEFSARSLASHLQDLEQITEEVAQDSFLITMNCGLGYLSPGDALTPELLQGGICIPPIIPEAIPTTSEIIARLDSEGRPLVVCSNRICDGEAIFRALKDDAWCT